MQALPYIVQSGVFSDLPHETVAALAARCEVRFVEAGELIARAGLAADRLVLLAEGKLVVYRRNKERDVALLMGILEAPSIFGDAEIAAGAPWLASVRAETDACCVMIPGGDYLAVVEKHAAFAARMYKDACVRHLLAHHTAQTIALFDTETRLLRLLLDYASRFGKRLGDDALLAHPLTQVEMASALGVTRKTVQRTLKPLEDRGVVARRDDGSWLIRGLAALEAALPRYFFGLSSRFGEPPAPVISRWTEAIAREDGE